MTPGLFSSLILKDESSKLDFKKTQYKVLKGEENELAKFIKDVISFSNTIRETTSYIIIGIEEVNRVKIHCGLDNYIDDAIFQDKIKDKVNPKPHFKYYSFEYNDIRYGIFEFPLIRYAQPILALTRMKGLEINKVYFRRGSTNSEADSVETININNWITNIISPSSLKEINSQISKLITEINLNEYYSPFLSTALEISKEIKNDILIEFCNGELLGWNKNNGYTNCEHRTLKCLWSFNTISHAIYRKGTPIEIMWAELKTKGFHEDEIILGDSVNQIEFQIKENKKGEGNKYITYPIKASEKLPHIKEYRENDYDLYQFWNENDIKKMYNNSKQKFIELLTLSIS